jgi:hypothetical protein
MKLSKISVSLAALMMVAGGGVAIAANPMVCQTAFKRDPRSASKKDPLADMMGVC